MNIGRLRTWVLKYGITCAVGGVFTYAYYTGYKDEFVEVTGKSEEVITYLCLSNGFIVPGILLLCIGFLVFVSSLGAFDGIGYLLSGLLRRLIPGGQSSDHSMEKYYDYLQRRKEKKLHGYSFLFVCGGVFTVVGILFQALYYGAL